jgi:UDP-N-acetylmuramyl pentapeptide phosphotransferase/UDP-N-acetylglucosamine-1-phosphate transferase
MRFVDNYDFAILFSAIAICCFLIVLTKFFPRLAGRSQDLVAVQSAHERLTPRVGGGAVFGALATMSAFMPETLAVGWSKFVPSVGVLFLIGLMEDLGYHVSPKGRLAAAGLASLVFILMTGVWLPRVDIPLLDDYLPLWIVGVPITLFVTAGAANGFNLIDGVNGLAGVTGFACAVALAAIAWQGEYIEMTHVATMLAAGILGFLLLNYPFGLIFLGDAGAYSIGFVLSWFGISILLNVPDASAWAILLTLFWPVADTLLAILRRVQRNAPSFQPDRLHVHQLVMRCLEILWLGRNRRKVANPLTTIVLIPVVIAPVCVGVILWDAPLAAFSAFAIFLGVFFASYRLAFKLLPQRRRRNGSGRSGSLGYN